MEIRPGKFQINSFITYLKYRRWIRLRNKSKDGHGDKLCYCGHTYKCSCCNPDKQLFIDSVKRGAITLWDKENGWRTDDCLRNNDSFYCISRH